jgi:uroporphyrinogen-III synthase
LRDALSGQGFHVEPVPVYDAVPVAPAEIGDAGFFAGIGGIVVHSSAGARAVRRFVQRSGWCGRIWCISPASAAQLAGLEGVALSCAAEPTELALLALVEQEALPTRWPAQAMPDRLPLKPIRIGRRHGQAANDGDEDGSPPAA